MKKFALIGCGQVAERHAENMKRIGGLAAVCDVVKEKREAFASMYNANAYEDFEALLQAEKDIDIVAVCTPNGLHAEHIIKSLQAKKHVLCEAPLCLTTAAAWQIIETEKFCRRKLFLVNIARQNLLLAQLKNFIDDRDMGTVNSFHLSCLLHQPTGYDRNWRHKLFPGGGTLYTEFSRYIDAMTWLFGEVDEAKGFSDNAVHNQSSEVEDGGTASLQMKNGTLGSLHWSANAFGKKNEVTLTILAEKGTIRIGGEYLQDIQHCETEVPLSFTGIVKNEVFDNNTQYLSAAYKAVYDNLMQELDNKNGSSSTVFEGMNTVDAIEKIYKSARPL